MLLAGAAIVPAAHAAVVTVPASAWTDVNYGQSVTAQAGGSTVSMTTADGFLTASPYDGTYDGVWFGQNIDADGTYALSFGGQTVSSVSMYFTAATAAAGAAPEIFSAWSTIGGSASSLQITDNIGMTVSGSGSLSSLVVTASVADGSFRLTISSNTGFTGISFRHTQATGMNGSLLNELSFETVAVPAPGGLAVLLAGGLSGRRRRR